ncbi:5-hydroxytryptamine receptor 3A-like [Ylistrum balloti]|uniref:5-hydroxytryptamine receptor 3A-like n=1 Tax=Ylistrum balloti TaxID=509963 RepID=UPI002905EB88|nr:5-hydroxytryptamine receptor 3A-like [Ylistrum balloti]
MAMINRVVTLCCIASFTSAASYSQVRDLYNSLLINYTSNIRPVLDQTKAINVDIDVMLHSINLFDEVSGKLSMSGIFRFSWTDELLQWNPMSANGISSMMFTTSQVWVPNVFIGNGVDQTNIFKPSDSIEISYTREGSASLRFFQIFDVVCQAGMTYYPNDIHTCKIEMAQMTNLDLVNLTSSKGIILTAYYSNLIWNVESTTMENVIVGRQSKAMFYITIGRRPTFIFLTLVLPIIALNYVNLLVFFIPTDSGERISYSITVLLTFTVYLSVYSDKVPPLSLPIGIFSVSMLIKLFTSCLISLSCIVISRISYYQEDYPVPSTLQKLTASFRRNRKIRSSLKTPARQNSTVDVVETMCNTREAETLSRDENRSQPSTPVTVVWKEVVDFLDKLCLVLFTLTSTVETVVCLILIITRH